MNKKRIIWLIPVLAMALAMSACGDSGDSGGGGGGLANLNFKDEQVWTIDPEGAYAPYTGTEALTNNAGGAGSITEGKLSFNVGTPSQSRLVPMGTFLTSINDKFKIFPDAEWNPSSPIPNAMELAFSSSSINLSKVNYTTSTTSTLEETVRYIYVDRDCTLKAASKPNVSVVGVSVPVTVSELNLSLKQGWNIINSQMTITATGGTASITKGNLESCKWILELLVLL